MIAVQVFSFMLSALTFTALIFVEVSMQSVALALMFAAFFAIFIWSITRPRPKRAVSEHFASQKGAGK